MCNVYGSIVQRVGEKVSFGHLIENTSREALSKMSRYGYLWIIVLNCYHFTNNFNSKVAGLQDGSVVVLFRHPLYSPY